MDIEFAFGAFLGTRTAVTSVVGTGIYGDKAPQGKLPPFIRYEQVGGDKFYHSRGASDLAEAVIQITCRETTYVKAKTLYELIRNEVDGGIGTWSGVTIRGAFLSEPVNVSQPDASGGSDSSDCAVRGEMRVHYVRAVPTLLGMP